MGDGTFVFGDRVEVDVDIDSDSFSERRREASSENDTGIERAGLTS